MTSGGNGFRRAGHERPAGDGPMPAPRRSGDRLERRLGTLLRRRHDHVLAEPVPEDMLLLARRLGAGAGG